MIIEFLVPVPEPAFTITIWVFRCSLNCLQWRNDRPHYAKSCRGSKKEGLQPFLKDIKDARFKLLEKRVLDFSRYNFSGHIVAVQRPYRGHIEAVYRAYDCGKHNLPISQDWKRYNINYTLKRSVISLGHVHITYMRHCASNHHISSKLHKLPSHWHYYIVHGVIRVRCYGYFLPES